MLLALSLLKGKISKIINHWSEYALVHLSSDCPAQCRSAGGGRAWFCRGAVVRSFRCRRRFSHDPLAHYRLGNVDFKMGIYLLIGGVIGGTGGVQIIRILRQMGNADFLIKITYVIMLGFVGGYMFFESLQGLRDGKSPARAVPQNRNSVYSRFIQALPFQTRFDKSGIVLSPIIPLFLGGMVGILAAIMGVGGGFVMVPVMVYLLRMPMHVVVGTSLFQVLFTCIDVTIMQAYSNRTVDFVLALLLLIGSTFGAQIGARLSTRLKDDQLKIFLAVLVLVVMVKMLFSLVLPPHTLLSYHGGH